MKRVRHVTGAHRVYIDLVLNAYVYLEMYVSTQKGG